MIYTIGGIKGGTGKSALAMNFVIWLIKKGLRVLFIDADKQQTSAKWVEIRQTSLAEKQKELDFDFETMTAKLLFKFLISAKDRYDAIVIDAGEGENPALRSALMACDVFIWPLRPLNSDVWSVKEVTELLEEIDSTRIGGPVKALSFLTSTEPPYLEPNEEGMDETRESAAFLSSLENVKFIPYFSKKRRVFNQAIGLGLTVFELKNGRQAAKELKTIFSEIINLSNHESSA